MAADFKLVQQILRNATEDESFTVLEDSAVDTVYAELRTLQQSLREICDEGRVLTESEVAGSRFRYSLSGGVLNPGPEKWLIALEQALQIVDRCTTVTEIRAHLKSVGRTHANYQNLTH